MPTFSAHRRHGAKSGPGQACLLRPPFPVHRPDRRKASPAGSGEKKPNRHIYMARGLKLPGGSGPVRRGNGNRPRTKCAGLGLLSRAAPRVNTSLGRAERRRYGGTDRAAKRWSRRTLTTREKLPGRPREARSRDTHLPGVRARLRWPPSSPIQALRGSRILITTKNLTKDPLPLPRCARSPRRGSPEPVQKSRSRGELRGASAPPHHRGARPVPGEVLCPGTSQCGRARQAHSVRHPPARQRGGSAKPAGRPLPA